MLSDEVNLELVWMLRDAAMRGQPASALLKLLSRHTSCGRSSEARSVATCHFEVAFGWHINESKPLGAWNYFQGSYWDDDMIDTEFRPLLEEWRNTYVPDS